MRGERTQGNVLERWHGLSCEQSSEFILVFEVSCFCVCTCKHHTLISETLASLFEKPKYTNWSTPKEVLLHVYIFSRFLTTAYLTNCTGTSDRKTNNGSRRRNVSFGNERIKYTWKVSWKRPWNADQFKSAVNRLQDAGFPTRTVEQVRAWWKNTKETKRYWQKNYYVDKHKNKISGFNKWNDFHLACTFIKWLIALYTILTYIIIYIYI